MDNELSIESELDYSECLMGFVLIASEFHIESVKDAVSKGLFCMESDDRAYLYAPGDNEVCKRAKAVAKVADFNLLGPRIDLSLAIDQSFEILRAEDFDYAKVLFVIVDQYNVLNNLKIKLLLQKEECDCHVFLCGLGRGYDKAIKELSELENTTFRHFDRADGLTDFIRGVYKEQNRENHG